MLNTMLKRTFASLLACMPFSGALAQAPSAPESNVARLVALLKLLDSRHPDERWSAYLLASGQLDWSRILVAGLSQGAGMAAFIAKQEAVLRVVCFSSPYDVYAGPNGGRVLAPWLHAPGATPLDRWYAERNVREPAGELLVRAYADLLIPSVQIRVFLLPAPPGVDLGKNPMFYHGSTVKDPRYVADWNFLYGTAVPFTLSAASR